MEEKFNSGAVASYCSSGMMWTSRNSTDPPAYSPPTRHARLRHHHDLALDHANHVNSGHPVKLSLRHVKPGKYDPQGRIAPGEVIQELGDVIFVRKDMSCDELQGMVFACLGQRYGESVRKRAMVLAGDPGSVRGSANEQGPHFVLNRSNCEPALALAALGGAKTIRLSFALPEDFESEGKKSGFTEWFKKLFTKSKKGQ